MVIWRTDPRRGRLVVACCDSAAAMGVRTGMPIAQAAELCSAPSAPAPASRGGKEAALPATGSPGHVAHLHDPVLDAQAIEQLAAELQQHISPLVAIESLDAKPWAGQTIHAPDTLLCDITGIAHLFGGEAGLLKAAEEQLQRLGLQGRLAIANSVGAAWALAHYRRAHDRRHTIAGHTIARSNRQLMVTTTMNSPRCRFRRCEFHRRRSTHSLGWGSRESINS